MVSSSSYRDRSVLAPPILVFITISLPGCLQLPAASVSQPPILSRLNQSICDATKSNENKARKASTTWPKTWQWQWSWWSRHVTQLHHFLGEYDARRAFAGQLAVRRSATAARTNSVDWLSSYRIEMWDKCGFSAWMWDYVLSCAFICS